MKSSPQIALPMAAKARASGVATPAKLADRNEERQADSRILQHVAVPGEHDALPPVAGIGQPVVRAAAVHPLLAFLGIVIGERKMRGAVAERCAHGDALGIERVGDAARRGLGALLVDVPAVEMLQRAGVHSDERWMDDGPGIHQRAGERVAAILDHAGESLRDDGQRVVLARERKHAGGQALGPHGDRDLERPMLARQPRQRPGFRKGHVGRIAGITCSLGEQHRAERCRRQEHHLSVQQDAARAPSRCPPARSRAPGTGSARPRARPRPCRR